MKLTALTIYALRIPFTEAFAHSARQRSFSDAVVVRLRAEDGTTGYGEGVARPYVTGETVEQCVEHIKRVLWPALKTQDYAGLVPDADPLRSLREIEESLPDKACVGVRAFHAARCAVELALTDCLLRSQGMSLAEILPPRRQSVVYSGVISSGSISQAVKRARQLKLFGIREVKIKISERDEKGRLAAVRETLGADARLRIDANGAYDARRAISIAQELSDLKIEAFEQPIPAGRPGELAQVRARSPIPIMADESLVTLGDALALAAADACDFFNLRLSKCGGLSRTLRMARVAEAHGIRLQVGCQVGETAILSAAARHLVAHLERVAFAEGSYGTLLLEEDVCREPVHFGHGGRAALLRATGLGVSVREEVLERRAASVAHLGKER